jgi:PAS domain-containing protein
MLTDRFETLFRAYVSVPDEEHLAGIAELGEQLVQARVPPEEIVEVFEGALLGLSGESCPMQLPEHTDRIFTPLIELLIAYGLAFREQIAKQRLYEETRLAKRIIENTLEGIWVADHQGNIQVVNPSLLKITGFSSEELIGRNLSVLYGSAFCTDQIH